jgi:predicted transcriptional regulator
MPSTLTRVLGPLERQTLDVIGKSDMCSVRDVVRRLSGKRAYTTVKTTLDRLYQKRILNRKGVGGKFFYSARMSRQELEESIARGLLTRMLASSTTSRELVISSLLEAIRQYNPKLFDKNIEAMTRVK